MNKIFYILVLFAVAFVSSCQDDDEFSTSKADRLTMDMDSVRFDTVFSRTPTAAKTFWVRNFSGKGIRCTSVRLERGNQSGFRVNIDGSFLGSQTGYKSNDIEVRKGDSIRVFVELTAPKNNIDGPQLREDNIVFTLESGAQQKVNLNAYTWDADTIHTLHIRRDSTIDTTVRPLIVYDRLIVDSLATLTVAKGSTVYFHDNAGMEVYGTLKCQGDAKENVVLRGYRLDNMFDYLPYDLTPGHWQGIHFHSSSFNNVIDYTDLHSAYDAIICDSSSVDKSKLVLSNSTIHNCQGLGLSAVNAMIDMYNCQITNTLGHCVAVYGGDIQLWHCTLGQFYPFDLARGNALYFTNQYKDGEIPLKRIAVLNSIITGYDKDVIMGVADDSTKVDFNYYFGYSILRTPVVEDTIRFEHVIWEKTTDEIQGAKHFRRIDTDLLRYDFHLDSLSTAIGTADPKRTIATDRDGNERDLTKPNMGCY